MHRNRGTIAITAAGILPTYTGIASHDGWSAYWTFTGCQHALCNIHHERELCSVIENDHQSWAADLIHHLHVVKDAVAEAVAAGRDALTPEHIAQVTARYEEIIQAGLDGNPRAGAPKRGRASSKARRGICWSVSTDTKRPFSPSCGTFAFPIPITRRNKIFA